MCGQLLVHPLGPSALRIRVRSTKVGPLAVVAVALVAAGCSAATSPAAPPPRESPTTLPTTTSVVVPTTSTPSLSALPTPNQPGDGPGDKLLLNARGKGNRNLGTVDETGHDLYFQITCLGEGGVVLRNLTGAGPCDGTVSAVTMPWSKPLGLVDLDVEAAPGTRWALYVSQR